MSIIENKRLVRRFIEEVINTGNVENIEAFVSEDYTEVYNNAVYPVGIEGAKNHITGVRRTYPDLTLRVERQIAESDWVATQITARGTHEGEWMGIAPTGKALQYSGVNLDRVVDGRIVEHGGAANMMEPLLEIGALRIAGKEDT